jgi:hypothetical protein
MELADLLAIPLQETLGTFLGFDSFPSFALRLGDFRPRGGTEPAPGSRFFASKKFERSTNSIDLFLNSLLLMSQLSHRLEHIHGVLPSCVPVNIWRTPC